MPTTSERATPNEKEPATPDESGCTRIAGVGQRSLTPAVLVGSNVMSKAEKLEIEVRRATPEDIPSIVALDHQTLGIAHWSERVYGAIFESTSPLRMAWVALEPGQAEGLRGFLVAGVSAGHCQLENLAVAGRWRGRGIGSALVKRFLAEARALDLESITLEVRQSNQVARALYEKYGFAISGRRRSYYRDPEEDAILYALTHC